jgi:hypothetical protein
MTLTGEKTDSRTYNQSVHTNVFRLHPEQNYKDRSKRLVVSLIECKLRPQAVAGSRVRPLHPPLYLSLALRTHFGLPRF